MKQIVLIAWAALTVLPACAAGEAGDSVDGAGEAVLPPDASTDGLWMDAPPLDSLSPDAFMGSLPDSAPLPPVSLVAAGRGCTDRFCLWIQGYNLTMSTIVIVKDHNWNELQRYSGTQLVYGLQNNPQSLTLALATTAERDEVATYGLVLTVVDHSTWDNIGVSP